MIKIYALQPLIEVNTPTLFMTSKRQKTINIIQ